MAGQNSKKNIFQRIGEGIHNSVSDGVQYHTQSEDGNHEQGTIKVHKAFKAGAGAIFLVYCWPYFLIRGLTWGRKDPNKNFTVGLWLVIGLVVGGGFLRYFLFPVAHGGIQGLFMNGTVPITGSPLAQDTAYVFRMGKQATVQVGGSALQVGGKALSEGGATAQQAVQGMYASHMLEEGNIPEGSEQYYRNVVNSSRKNPVFGAYNAVTNNGDVPEMERVPQENHNDLESWNDRIRSELTDN